MRKEKACRLIVYSMLLAIGLVSCGDNTQAIKGNNNDGNEIIISDNVTINKTILENRTEEKVNKNNLDSIAIEYVGNYQDFISAHLVDRRGEEPYFLVAFMEDNSIKIHGVLKNANGRWKSFSKTKLPNSFKENNQQNLFIVEDEFVLVKTCVRRYCDVTFGLWLFNTTNKKTFGVFQGMENELAMPHDLPTELTEIAFVERKIYDHLPFKGNEFFAYGLLKELIHKLPKRNLINLKEIIPQKLREELLATCEFSNDFEIHSIYLEDFDGDSELEWMLFAKNLNRQKEEEQFKSYIVQIEKSPTSEMRSINSMKKSIQVKFNNEFLLSGIFDLNIYKNIDQPPFILASSFQGRERWFDGEILQCFEEYSKILDVGPQDPGDEGSDFFNKICKNFYTSCCACAN